ncbi:MAG: PD-(D/E)XK nuclease family protein [Planctomycetaceae bacterium]|nr:PD-(D/E)XK nuclease family protein [Planctomycetaceae bacterium]
MFADRRHWSFSAINQYLRCPLQYYFERVLKLPQPTVSSGIVLGSAVHAALADYHLNLQRRTPTNIDKLQRIVLAYWTLREAERPVQYKAGDNRVVLLATAIGLLETYLQQPPPEGIVGVEQRLLVPLINSDGDYLETPLAAVIDLLTCEGRQLKVREFKTSGRAYGEMEVETSLQATSYVNAVWHAYGEWAAVEYNILIKTKTPKFQRLTTARRESDVGRLGDIVENVERAVDQKIFLPIESPLNCSTCTFRQPCLQWKPQRNLVPLLEPVRLNGHVSCSPN